MTLKYWNSHIKVYLISVTLDKFLHYWNSLTKFCSIIKHYYHVNEGITLLTKI